jgi:hypothetical protein
LPGLEALLNISVGSWRLSLFIDAEGGFFTGRDAWFRVRFRLKAGRRATARCRGRQLPPPLPVFEFVDAENELLK